MEITSEMYDKIHQEYEDQLSRLTHEKQKYSEGKSEYELSIDTIFILARRSKEIFESSEVGEKKMLLRFLLQNPVLDERNPIFNLESPFDILLTEGDIKQKSQIGSEISDEMCKWLHIVDKFRTLDWRAIYTKLDTKGVFRYCIEKKIVSLVTS